MTFTFKLSRRLAGIHETTRHGWTWAPLLLVLAACSDGLVTSPDPDTRPDLTPAPVPGWVTLAFTTPWPDDGAVQLTVVGGPVLEVELLPGLTGYSGTTADGAHLLATGAIVSGVVARLRVPDLNRMSGYQVFIGQVAQRGSYALRSSTAGYRAEVVK